MQNFTFTSPRGHDLAARYEGPEGTPRATAVFAHCFTCSKDLRVERQIVSSLVSKGIGVLTFDFTGLGRSGGDFGDTTFTADVFDVVAAAAELGKRVDSPTLLVGHSLGGAAVLHAAGHIDSCKAVVTIGAPCDPGHVKHLFSAGIEEIERNGQAEISIGGRPFTIGKQFIDDLESQDPAGVVRDLGRALLVFHSPTDAIVGIENARQIYEAARHPKSFVSLDGADHLLTNPADAAYVASVTAVWASRYVEERVTEPGRTQVQKASGDATESNVVDGVTGHSESMPTRTGGSYEQRGARATTRGSLATDIETRGFQIRADEPASVGGTETGPTPYDLLAAALATCTSMTLRMYANHKKIALDKVTVSVTHNSVHAEDCKDCEHKEGKIAVLKRTLEINGDLTDAQRERMLSIADRCPVHKTLHGPIEVHTTLMPG